MKIKKLTLGQTQTNAYILSKDNKVIIIDPGFDYEIIVENISDDSEVIAILLTHGHFDHIGAVNDLLKVYDVDVYAHKKEAVVLNNPSYSFYDGVISKEITYFDDDFKLENFNVVIHKTPGHTIGSVMFEIDDNLFAGDMIFNMSVGRVDLPTASVSDMINSLKYINSLSKDFKVYPGQGPNTTLKYEQKNNPYLGDLSLLTNY